MQLFSIGLVQLNPDGTTPLDGTGQPFPTYDQAVIEGFAHVFTGWHYSGATRFSQARRTNTTQVQPMKAYPEQHASGTKRLLSYPGVTLSVLPDGQTPEQDLAGALDNVFNHPNVGPFIARPADPAPGHEQPVARLRRARCGRLQQRRAGAPRQPRRRRQGDPARSGSASGRRVRRATSQAR